MCRPASQPLLARGAYVSTGTNTLLLAGLVGGAHEGLGHHGDWAFRALVWVGRKRCEDAAPSSHPILARAAAGPSSVCVARANPLRLGEGSGGSEGCVRACCSPSGSLPPRRDG